MMLTSTLFLLLAAPGPLGQDTVEISFAPIAGRAVSKTVSTRHTLRADGFRRQIGDESTVMPLALKLDSEQYLTVVDEYRTAANGRPTELRRTYRDGGMRAELQPQVDPPAPPSKVELQSEIRDASVVFTWVPDEEQYGRYYDAAELPERWLPDLHFDLDALALLPEGSVSVGSSWTVGVGGLESLLVAYGDQHLAEAPRGSDRMLLRTLGTGAGANLHRAFGGESSGGMKLTLKSVDGDLARIGIEVGRVNLVRDLTDYTRSAVLRREQESGVATEGGRLALELQGRGELVWDRAAGRMVSLELSLQENVTMGVRQNLPDGETVEVWDEIRLTGILTHRVKCAPAEPVPVPGPARGR